VNHATKHFALVIFKPASAIGLKHRYTAIQISTFPTRQVAQPHLAV
jgi:hypothetical protein